MKNKTKKSTSWGWIIFWLIIFWPVGLFLLFKKLATDKSALMSEKTGPLSIIAWVLIVIGALGFMSSLSNFSFGGFIFVLGMIAGGILLLRKVNETKMTATKYKKYINIIANQNVKSIDNIASAMGIPYDVAIKDLQHMIDSNYLPGAYINQGNREIVLKQHEPVVSNIEQPVGQATPQMATKSCPGCGANNIVTVGSITECEYCGTPISA